uniref:Uncharacterized protein n=1 Tax=Zooxanthella nutricula TaxID=1333877 RepID=A0A7S2ITG6_9DINO
MVEMRESAEQPVATRSAVRKPEEHAIENVARGPAHLGDVASVERGPHARRAVLEIQESIERPAIARSAVGGREERVAEGVRPARKHLGDDAVASADIDRGSTLGLQVFEQVCEHGPVRASRKLFASLAHLFKKWNKGGVKFLHAIPSTSLFLLSCKRSSLFPKDARECAASTRLNVRYTLPQYQVLRDFLLGMEDKGQVYFLDQLATSARDASADGGDLADASTWLQSHIDPVTQRPYLALQLDPLWWQRRRQTATPRFVASITSIADALQAGPVQLMHVMELVYQSNPTINVVK